MRKTIQRILVSLCCLTVVVGCRMQQERIEPQADGQILDLAISIGKADSKAPIVGEAFADGTHSFGLVATKADDVTAYEAGSDHVLAQAVVSGATQQDWTYQWGSMSDAGTALPLLYAEDPMQVAGYYPYNALAESLEGRDGGRLNVPFDLTTEAEQVNQTDVMVSPVQTLTYNKTIGSQRVSLSFQHVYALLELQVKLKYAERAASITRVEVCNRAGKEFLANKGFFSPYTGTLTEQTAGTVALATNKPLSATDYTTIQVMIPPTLLEGYADGDIYVQLYDNEVADPKPFPILKRYLTQSGSYGFQAGERYTYQLLYDNGSLTVVDWSNTTTESTIGGGLLDSFMVYGELPFAAVGDLVGATTLSYDNYTGTVDQGTNGVYHTSDMNAYTNEQPFHHLEVALESELDGANITGGWAEALALCADKTTDGGGWRLPRAAELHWIYNNKTMLEAVPNFTAFGANFFWSATEYDVTDAWLLLFSNGGTSNYSKSLTNNAKARCVREVI